MGRHVEIAGAGFAGLVAAIALRQRGWTVRVHEANDTLRALGAGIFIWENGLRVLQAIGAYDDAMLGAHEAITYETWDEGRLIAAYVFERRTLGTRMITLTRAHLYAAIVRTAQREGVVIKTGSEVVGATPDGQLRTADGQVFHADLVIGADGVRSKVRDSLGLPTERNAYGDGIVRVLAPRCKDALGPGNWDYVLDLWVSRRGLRILYCPCNENELYLAMMAPVADREASAIPLNKPLWVEAFPMLAPVIRAIDAVGRYDPYETSKLARWSTGRVAIIGDAAHAMAPTLGQGAGTAMMNGLSLAVALDEHASIEAALAAWEARERPLTEDTQDRSAETAKERLMAGAGAWNARTLRAAAHVPTGCA